MSSKVTANNIVGDSFLLNTLHICRPAINPQPAITLLLFLLLKPPSVSSTLYTLEIPALSSRASSYLFGSCRGQPINFKSDFHGFTYPLPHCTGIAVVVVARPQNHHLPCRFLSPCEGRVGVVVTNCVVLLLSKSFTGIGDHH